MKIMLKFKHRSKGKETCVCVHVTEFDSGSYYQAQMIIHSLTVSAAFPYEERSIKHKDAIFLEIQ
jgi:hypothetical protein